MMYLTVYWLYRRTGASWLLDLVQLVQSQSYAWQAQYANFPYKERQAEWTLENHLVKSRDGDEAASTQLSVFP